MPAVLSKPHLDLWRPVAEVHPNRDTVHPSPVENAPLTRSEAAPAVPALQAPLAAIRSLFGHFEGRAAASQTTDANDSPVTPLAETRGTLGDTALPIRAKPEGMGGGNQESDDPQVREEELIAEALTESPNADRAQAAHDEIQRLREENPSAASRLTPEVVAMLINGVADSRSDSARGQAGVLGVEQVTEAAEALLGMPEQAYQELTTTLGQAGLDSEGQASAGADVGAEQALILKSLASRRDLLLGDPAQAEEAMAEITQFGADIRGTERDTLMANTTLIDVHDAADGSIDNDDALRQTYSKSCAPSVAIMARAEMDPIFAWQVQTGAIDPAQLQLDYLTYDGERAERREPRADNVTLDNAASGTDGTFVRDAYHQIGATEAANIQDPNTSRGTNNIMSVDPSYSDVLDSALREGQPVPLQTAAFGGHFMLATDVRVEGETTEYLVTDPWTGMTAWVGREDLLNGDLSETFGDEEVDGDLTSMFVEPY